MTPAPPITLRHATGLALGALLLAACGRDADPGPPPPDAAALAPLAADFDGRWQGVLPCLDCDGLEVALRLRRDGGEARFALVERYLGADAGGEFASEGDWREAACTRDGVPGLCVVLIDAGQQWFRDKDGSLQAISADGRPLDPDGARLARL